MMWTDALKSARRQPNSYAKLLRSAFAITSGVCGCFVLLLGILAIACGPDQVAEYLGGPDFLYGVVGRGMIIMIAVLFAGFLTTGWNDEEV